ncbi:MAG: head GIN domain-containing protein [Burkholderiales bacterium]
MKPALSIIGCALGVLAMSTAALGQASSKGYSVQGFDSITIRIPATVEVIRADRASVRITAEPKVLDRLQVTERNRSLLIESPKGFSTNQPLSIAIGTAELKAVVLEAAGDITISRPRGQQLDLRSSGAGTIQVTGAEIGVMKVKLDGSETVKLDGKASSLELKLTGASSVDASALRTSRVVVTVDGASDVAIHADESIDATVSGSGSVRYQGKATVKQRVSGAGSVERN